MSSEAMRSGAGVRYSFCVEKYWICIWQVIIYTTGQGNHINWKFTDVCQMIQDPTGSISISHVNITGFFQALMNIHGSCLGNTFIDILLIQWRRNYKSIFQTKLGDQLSLDNHSLGITFAYRKVDNASFSCFIKETIDSQSGNTEIFSNFLLRISFYIIIPGDFGQKFIFI